MTQTSGVQYGPPFKEGDVIRYHGKRLKILAIRPEGVGVSLLVETIEDDDAQT